MDKQIFYPIYALFICLYSIIFTLIGIPISKLVNRLTLDYDDKKNKLLVLIEILIEISINCVIVYILKEYTHYILMSINYLKRLSYGNPTKYASLLLSAVILLPQQKLLKKIKYVYSIIQQ